MPSGLKFFQQIYLILTSLWVFFHQADCTFCLFWVPKRTHYSRAAFQKTSVPDHFKNTIDKLDKQSALKTNHFHFYRSYRDDRYHSDNGPKKINRKELGLINKCLPECFLMNPNGSHVGTNMSNGSWALLPVFGLCVNWKWSFRSSKLYNNFLYT